MANFLVVPAWNENLLRCRSSVWLLWQDSTPNQDLPYTPPIWEAPHPQIKKWNTSPTPSLRGVVWLRGGVGPSQYPSTPPPPQHLLPKGREFVTKGYFAYNFRILIEHPPTNHPPPRKFSTSPIFEKLYKSLPAGSLGLQLTGWIA